MRNARSFGQERGVTRWETRNGEYEFHAGALRSESAQRFADFGVARAGAGDVVCNYRKRGGSRARWLSVGDTVRVRNPESPYGVLAGSTAQELKGMAERFGDDAHALTKFALCRPLYRQPELEFEVAWSDSVSGPLTREQRESYAQEYVEDARTGAPTRGSGSTVVGQCVLHLIKPREEQQFWSCLFRVYGTDVFGLREFQAYASEFDVPQEFTPSAMEGAEEEEDNGEEWAEDAARSERAAIRGGDEWRTRTTALLNRLGAVERRPETWPTNFVVEFDSTEGPFAVVYADANTNERCAVVAQRHEVEELLESDDALEEFTRRLQ